ncbi:MAG: hypothetical protein KDA79_01600 [Planctomycetaceae bacterium]|nr:hypothetical protein [Planctomycetaceae bacterium]
MKAAKVLTIFGGLAIAFSFSGGAEVDAGSYGGWNYYGSRGYYYSTYNYTPTRYHYCVYYPSKPRYTYYYNPYSQSYWGRYDLQGKPGAEYSLLAEKDRKKTLSDIPESAFPEPGALPKIDDPEANGATLDAPPAPPETN